MTHHVIATPLTQSAKPSVFMELLPIMATVLVAFLVIGIALPVLPLHVHNGLGYGPFIVGLVAGSQFAASLLSRFWSGRICDAQGPKRAVLLGLAGATGAGLLYLLSLAFANPVASVAVLLAGRLEGSASAELVAVLHAACRIVGRALER
ncbi:MFS transporter [Mesorhizobium sp. LjNodule214]|uniref:MFS transporter n=1 Tax=Mesorhizobium sp. LjNodule214 TaxID=3342252 RepID=UPI003F507A7F